MHVHVERKRREDEAEDEEKDVENKTWEAYCEEKPNVRTDKMCVCRKYNKNKMGNTQQNAQNRMHTVRKRRTENRKLARHGSAQFSMKLTVL